MVGSIILPLTSFSSIQNAFFRKKLLFKKIAVVRIFVKLVPLIVSVPLALFGMSYWALIVGNIVSEIVNAILLTRLSEWKPSLKYSSSKLKEMFQFCIWSLLESISSWLVSNIGIFIIGQVFNEYYLGIYKTSITVVNQVISIITASTITVLLSALSESKDNFQQYSNIFFNFLHGIGILVIPFGVGMLLFNDVLRGILLGSQWKDADLLLGLWGFILAESVIFNGMSGAIILSLGKPKGLFLSNVSQILFMIPAMMLGSSYGFSGFVIATCIVRIELPLSQTIMACHYSGIKFKNIINEIKNYIIATFIMTACGILLRYLNNECYWSFLEIILCIIIYFFVLICIPKTRNEIMNYINLLKEHL